MPSSFQQRAASLPLLAALIVGCASSGGKPAATSPAP